MTKLKKYNTLSDWETAKSNLVYPSVGLVEGDRSVVYMERPISVGDVAYWDGSKVKTISYSKWSSYLGTPIGVVVIPEGIIASGVRIVGLNYVDDSGNAISDNTLMAWSLNSLSYTGLPTKYRNVPITINDGPTSYSYNSMGYLPSDKFTGATSYVDPEAKYNISSLLIPSPYLGDKINLDCFKNLGSSSNIQNACSDIDGLNNTQILVGESSNHVAANAAYKYSDGESNTQWYLPAMGELVFLMARINTINTVITDLGGTAIYGPDFLWSATESLNFKAFTLYPDNGFVKQNSKSSKGFVRPFACLA